MLTRRVKGVPLYPVRLCVMIYDEVDDLPYCYRELAHGSVGFYHCGSDLREFLLAVRSGGDMGTIAHESEHVKNKIFAAIGYETDNMNDEVDAYLLGWIVMFVLDVYKLHGGVR